MTSNQTMCVFTRTRGKYFCLVVKLHAQRRPDSEQIEPAGAKPLRRNSVSVEQIQEESSNAHHKRDDDICYHLFYFDCFDGEKLLLKFERGASRVRRTFAKRTTFFEAKSVDTFNASDSRQSSNAHHKKPHDICYSVFYFVVLMT